MFWGSNPTPGRIPDQRLGDARTRREAVSVHEDLHLSPVNRFDRERRAVLLGREAHHNRCPGRKRGHGYGN